MKKLISIILSLALVACMFGMTVGAVDITVAGDAYHVVGERSGVKGQFGDGLLADEFTSAKEAQAIIKMSLKAATSRYAVDIVFTGSFTIEVEGLTWDVNKLAYITESDEPVTNQKYGFEVTNYSDQPVTVKASCDIDDNVEAAGVTCAFGTVEGQVKDGATAATHVINGNVHKASTANKSKFSATIAPTADGATWATVINDLIAGQAAREFIFATFTVTVSK